VRENDNDKTPGDPTVVLDEHSGLKARQDADTRRLRSAVRADQDTLLEEHLFAGPATSWSQAAEKACYVLRLFAASGEAQDPRYRGCDVGPASAGRRSQGIAALTGGVALLEHLRT
jgi:hypothetical protein